MAGKSVPFNKAGIGQIPDDKPVVYTIETDAGTPNYVGSAKRGRVQDRLLEHLDGPDRVPGARVKIGQATSIDEARQRETKLIAKLQPKHNQKGK